MRSCLKKEKKKNKRKVIDMVQGLSTQTALAKDLSLVPSTHIGQPTAPVDLTPSYSLSRQCTHMNKPTLEYTIISLKTNTKCFNLPL